MAIPESKVLFDLLVCEAPVSPALQVVVQAVTGSQLH